MPNSSSDKQNMERSSNVVIIIVIEGNDSFKEIEQEFSRVFGDGWRCTAKPIGPNQFTMSFLDPREVERVIRLQRIHNF
jgi:hypothetical protein